MITVPKNKTVYVGARRFIEGDILPPHISFEIPTLTKEQVEKIEAEIEDRPIKRKRGKPRKKR